MWPHVCACLRLSIELALTNNIDVLVERFRYDLILVTLEALDNYLHSRSSKCLSNKGLTQQALGQQHPPQNYLLDMHPCCVLFCPRQSSHQRMLRAFSHVLHISPASDASTENTLL